MLLISTIGTMTLKPIATKADSKVELTAGVTSYINSVMLGKIEPTVIQNEPVVVEQTYEEPTVPTCRTDVDMTGNSEYQALKAKIEEKEKALADENDTSELIRKLKNERNELLRQVSSVDTKIELGVANNKRIDDSIADLENKRTDLNQEIADWERKLDLLKEFTRKKNELLQTDVNKYLNFATAKLFRPLLNGDTEECCDFVYNGEAYARNLNHGRESR